MMIRLFVFLLVLATVAVSAADAVRCAACGRAVRGSYYRLEKAAACSKRCLERLLPHCAACGRAVNGPHSEKDGKPYCSDRCLATVLPKCEICGTALKQLTRINGHDFCEKHGDGPRCLHCRLPFGRGRRLADGRFVCAACEPSLFFSEREARVAYREARQAVYRATGYLAEEIPPLRLVRPDEMPFTKEGVIPADMIERGHYVRNTETLRHVLPDGEEVSSETRVTKEILILQGLDPREFLASAAHELTHDLLAELVPDVSAAAPKWLLEGLCQYVTAEVLLEAGADARAELERLEENPDPDYGGGYRYLRDTFGRGAWGDILDRLVQANADRLPPEPGPF